MYFNYDFEEVNIEVDENEQLLSGFFSAINMLSKKLYSKYIERMVIGEFTILFKYEEPLVFLYVCKGNSYTGLKKIELFVQKIVTSPLIAVIHT